MEYDMISHACHERNPLEMQLFIHEDKLYVFRASRLIFGSLFPVREVAPIIATFLLSKKIHPLSLHTHIPSTHAHTFIVLTH